MPKMWKQEHVIYACKLPMPQNLRWRWNNLLGISYLESVLCITNPFSWKTGMLNRWADREKVALILFNFLLFYYSVI